MDGYGNDGCEMTEYFFTGNLYRYIPLNEKVAKEPAVTVIWVDPSNSCELPCSFQRPEYCMRSVFESSTRYEVGVVLFPRT